MAEGVMIGARQSLIITPRLLSVVFQLVVASPRLLHAINTKSAEILSLPL